MMNLGELVRISSNKMNDVVDVEMMRVIGGDGQLKINLEGQKLGVYIQAKRKGMESQDEVELDLIVKRFNEG